MASARKISLQAQPLRAQDIVLFEGKAFAACGNWVHMEVRDAANVLWLSYDADIDKGDSLIRDLRFSGSHHLIMVLGTETMPKEMLVWDLETKEQTLRFIPGNYDRLLLSADRSAPRFVAPVSNETVGIVDIPTRRILQTFSGLQCEIAALAPIHPWIAAATFADSGMRLAVAGMLPGILERPIDGFIQAICWSADETHLWVSYENRLVKYRSDTLAEVETCEGFEGWVDHMAMRGHILAASIEQHGVQVMNLATHQRLVLPTMTAFAFDVEPDRLFAAHETAVDRIDLRW
ncbi:MAG: hypothetical protein U0670_03285 [Anaerolineae bacterium]